MFYDIVRKAEKTLAGSEEFEISEIYNRVEVILRSTTNSDGMIGNKESHPTHNDFAIVFTAMFKITPSGGIFMGKPNTPALGTALRLSSITDTRPVFFTLRAPGSRSSTSNSSSSTPTPNLVNSLISASDSLALPATPNSPTATLPSFDSYDDFTIHFLRAINAKLVKGVPYCFDIGDGGYAAAISRLEQSDPDTFALVSDGRPRFDLFHDTFMVLRMPEKVQHSGSIAKVSALIIKHIGALQATYPEESTTWRFLNNIDRMGTGDIKLFGGSMVHPDDQFQLDDDTFPGLVLESANSQRFSGKGGLDYKMHTEIVESDGRIKTVIGLELRGRHPRLSMCIPEFKLQPDGQTLIKRKIVFNRAYLESDGNLELFLNNFASDKIIRRSYPGLDQTGKITMSFEEILNAIHPLAALQKKRDEHSTLKPKPQNIPEPFTPSPPTGEKPPGFAKSLRPISYSNRTKSTKEPNRQFSTLTAHFKGISQPRSYKPIMYQPPILALAASHHTHLHHPLPAI
ncbi:hypothetical protein G7Y89_g7301 [Cudoniella acicularis]|uniref:Uncharacterized protein n=1 Tax=Cudoniella acicularis TaxID=354080 RepID=A0A8H4W237_9HELO|nr:hypothetical protein G7Y89_g7301 [Cudoniella acicularis]